MKSEAAWVGALSYTIEPKWPDGRPRVAAGLPAGDRWVNSGVSNSPGRAAGHAWPRDFASVTPRLC
ncbi:hypothetical protein GCM10020360_26220 [Nonlabens tegetincola]